MAENTAKIKVLFLCTGNSARSQMAEAFLRHLAGERYQAFSAGLEPKGIHPNTIQAMEEIGISLEGQWSKSVREYLGKENFGYLITVCDHAEKNCPTSFLGVSKRLHWSFEDPAAFQGAPEETQEKFRQVRQAIREKIQTWVEENQAASSTA